MSVTVYVSATLRGFVNRNAKLEAEGSIRPFVAVYLNDQNVTGQQEAPVQEGDVVRLLPAIAGGAPTASVISDERRKEISLDDKEIERYNKHLMLREISVKGQKRIRAAKVVVIGLGALGSPVVQYLAAAGVGTLGIIDFDEVSLGNLQSQVIHGTRDVNRPKTASARDTIRAINPKVQVVVENVKVEADNIEELIEDYDVVVDCTDNYKSRYLISDACVLLKKPLVFGAIYQYEGQVSVIDASEGPCYRCQLPSPPPAGLVPTCAEGGTISPLAGTVGSYQANEVLKLIIGGGESLIGKMLVIDRLSYYYEHENSNVHRGAHTMAAKSTDAYEGARQIVADFIGAPSKDNIIFVRGTTEAINLVAHSYVKPLLQPGDEIIVSQRAGYHYAGGGNGCKCPQTWGTDPD